MNPSEQNTQISDAKNPPVGEKSSFGNKISVVFIATASFLLAGVAIFSAYRLFQTNKQDSLTVPESQPLAENQITPTLQPTNTPPIPTPYSTPILTPTPTRIQTTPTITPTSTRTPTPTKTPAQSQETSSDLPEAGISLPTTLLISASFFFAIISISLLII